MLQPNVQTRLRQAVGTLPEVCGPDLRMEQLIDPALAALPELLQDHTAWSSVYIDYEPPFLMRISLPVEDPKSGRKIHIALHYFFGKPDGDAAQAAGIPNPYQQNPDLLQQQSANNYHPHPWATAFHLFEGSYRQRIGHATAVGYSYDPQSSLRPSATTEQAQDASDPALARYAFNDKLIWHQVLPNNGTPVASLMITYIPQDWDQNGPKPVQKQRPLSEAEKDFMFSHFKKILTLTALKPEAPKPGPRR